jgi:predicted ArsR family transcriptional regulator
VIKPKLRQLLEYIENSQGGISLGRVAKDLEISVNQVENMLEYWVRKGRLQISEPSPDCGSCASNGSCPYLVEIPHIYINPSTKDFA